MGTSTLIIVVTVISLLCRTVNSDSADFELSADDVRLNLWIDQHFSNELYVTLNCDLVPSNAPKVIETRFFRNDTQLRNDPEKGITIFGSTLTLSKTNHALIGDYYCRSFVQDLGSFYSDHVIWTTDYVATTPVPEITNTSGIKLEINFKLDEPFTSDNIELKDDVAFTCNIIPSNVKIAKRRWFLNGTELVSNASAGVLLLDSALQLPAIKPNYVGVYTCEIRTADNVTIKSNPVPIRRVKTQIFGTVKHQDEQIPELYISLGQNLRLSQIKEHDNVYLTCSIQPDLRNYREVTWLHNRTTINQTNRHDIDILETSSILVLPRIEHSSAGRYVCVVKTARGFTHRSNTMSIEVKKDPWNGTYAANDPLAIAYLVDLPDFVQIDEDVDFDCKIYPNTTNVRKITWFRDNQKLDPNVDRNIATTGPSLKILRMNQDYLGYYTCRIETDTANVTSISVPILYTVDKYQGITVNTSGRIPFMDVPLMVAKLGPPAQLDRIREKDNIYLTCEPQPNGFSLSSITWYHNDKEIIPGEKRNVDILFGGLILVLRNVGKNTTGKYACFGMTDHNIKTSAISVEIERIRGPLINSTDPANGVIAVAELLDYPDFIYQGEDVSFYCNVYPRKKRINGLKWIRNGEIFEATNQSFYSFSKSKRTFTIHSINSTNTGNYSCQIVVGNTTIMSNVIPLTNIKSRDKLPYYKNPGYASLTLIQVPTTLFGEIRVEDNLYFYCDIEPKSTPVSKITWYQNNYVQLPRPGNGIELRNGNQTFIHYNVVKDSGGYYYCSAKTKRGELESNKVFVDILDARVFRTSGDIQMD